MENLKIKFTTDSMCDLTFDLINRYEISEVLPLQILIGGSNLYDGTFDTQEI